jgi:hypothetical protein
VNEIVGQVQEYTSAPQFSTQDLVELGSLFNGNGFTGAESRALISTVEQTAKQVALAMMPVILEHVRKINEARLITVMTQIQMLPNNFGHVSRDRVQQIIRSVYSSVPTV